jgi:predicted thioesterase
LLLVDLSVGTTLSVRHRAATPIGMRVTARAELLAVDGRTLSFRVEAYDECELSLGGLALYRNWLDYQSSLRRSLESAC